MLNDRNSLASKLLLTAPIFLTSAELRELTGYAYNSRQIAWLLRNGWKFEVNAQKRPKVARSYFEYKVGSAGLAIDIPDLTSIRPNFLALNQRKDR